MQASSEAWVKPSRLTKCGNHREAMSERVFGAHSVENSAHSAIREASP